MLRPRLEQDLLLCIVQNAIELATECLPVLQANSDTPRDIIIRDMILPWAFALEAELRDPGHDPDAQPFNDSVATFADRQLSALHLPDPTLRDYTIVPSPTLRHKNTWSESPFAPAPPQ